jgi:hypothetical protein
MRNLRELILPPFSSAPPSLLGDLSANSPLLEKLVVSVQRGEWRKGERGEVLTHGKLSHGYTQILGFEARSVVFPRYVKIRKLCSYL